MLSDTISYRMYNYTLCYVMEKSKLRKKERRILLALHKNERRYMRKLALDDEILMSIDKAARYIGGEVNSVMKDKGFHSCLFSSLSAPYHQWNRKLLCGSL